MIGLDQVRSYALALPGVTESTHFRMPSFRVGDKGFVTLFQGTHLHVGVSQSQAEELAADDPDTFEPLWRQGRFFMGLRVDLNRVSAARVRELIEMGWRHKAPKSLASEHARD